MKDLLNRKIIRPVLQQIKVGGSPRKFALSAGFGVAVGVIPVLWTSTILGFVFGFIFKLNQITIQAVNYALQIFQYLLIPIYLYWGDKLFGVSPLSLTPKQLQKMISELGGKGFMIKFGSSIWHGAVLWAITAPFLIGITYMIFLPIFKNLHALHSGIPDNPSLEK